MVIIIIIYEDTLKLRYIYDKNGDALMIRKFLLVQNKVKKGDLEPSRRSRKNNGLKINWKNYKELIS